MTVRRCPQANPLPGGSQGGVGHDVAPTSLPRTSPPTRSGPTAQRGPAGGAGGPTIKGKGQLPGGVIDDSREKHYRELLDTYYIPQVHFDAPFSIAEIVAAGETRWDFHP